MNGQGRKFLENGHEQQPLAARMTAPSTLPPGALPRCLNRAQSAEYVGVGTSLFDEMVRDHRMPQPIRINARTVWDRLQLDEAVNALRDAADDTYKEDSWADYQ